MLLLAFEHKNTRRDIMKVILLISILLFVFINGCTQKKENNTGNQQPPATQEDTSTPQSLEPPGTQEDTSTPLSFEKGVFIDLSKHKDDFITDEILQKLKDNLEALVNKDENRFKAGLLEGHDTPGNMAYVKDTNQYKILDISFSKYDPKAKSIMISLPIQILRDTKIDDSTITYYFKPDKTGVWKIALID
jgi:hypothetical protein